MNLHLNKLMGKFHINNLKKWVAKDKGNTLNNIKDVAGHIGQQKKQVL